VSNLILEVEFHLLPARWEQAGISGKGNGTLFRVDGDVDRSRTAMRAWPDGNELVIPIERPDMSVSLVIAESHISEIHDSIGFGTQVAVRDRGTEEVCIRGALTFERQKVASMVIGYQKVAAIATSKVSEIAEPGVIDRVADPDAVSVMAVIGIA